MEADPSNWGDDFEMGGWHPFTDYDIQYMHMYKQQAMLKVKDIWYVIF